MRKSLLVVLSTLACLTALLTAGSAEASRKASVTLKPIPAQSEVGKKVTLKGKFSGGRATVKLQRKYLTGGWQTVRKVSTNAKGKYAAKVSLTQGGTTAFRAVKGGAKSAVRSLKVYAWLDVVTQPALVDLEDVLLNTTVRLGGRSHPRSVVAFDQGESYLWLRPDQQCTTFQAWSGFRDGDTEGLVGTNEQLIGTVSITGAGQIVQQEHRTPVGPPVLRTSSVSGAEWLIVFADTDLDDASTGDHEAVLGHPRLRCNAPALPSFDETDLPSV
ncbi:hypothetical protein [Nocardioides sp. SYSU D00038]|uniref:hypothetical protein n=1 Tax=Nocardioides sp. SYSU D00038 TaxID=2812554 RepID=UPI001966DE18|nr:hypothetical protein [Nocardioides sp. SYSU D00038]